MPIRFVFLLHFRRDGVAVDDDDAVVGIVEQERLADPSQIGLPLLLERDPGPDPGVDEQIVAEPEGVDEVGDELDVRLRDGPPDHRDRLVVRSTLPGERDRRRSF